MSVTVHKKASLCQGQTLGSKLVELTVSVGGTGVGSGVGTCVNVGTGMGIEVAEGLGERVGDGVVDNG